MERAVLQNDKGFTLLETIIAMTILTVMMLGTLQALIGTYTFSRNNTLRDYAVKIAQELITDYRNIPYNDPALAGGAITPATYTRQIGNSTVTFTSQGNITQEVPNVAKSVTINITWTNKGIQHTVKSTTIVGL